MVKEKRNHIGWRLRYGVVTVEMLAVSVAILIPFLLALSELARLDLAARRLQFGVQQSCLVAAVVGNADPSFRYLPVESRVSVAMRPKVVALLSGGRACSATLKRRYWIATGTGHGESGD